MVCLGCALSLIDNSHARSSSAPAVAPENLDRLLVLLARHEYRLRKTMRPVSDIAYERLWHYIDFVWGCGDVAKQFKRLGPETRKRYDEHLEIMVRELTRERVARNAPPPVSESARFLWEESMLPGDKIAGLISLTETVARFARVRMVALAGLDPRLKGKSSREFSNPKTGCGRLFWGAWHLLKKADLESAASEIGAYAEKLRADLKELKPEIEKWIQRRNRLVHSMPATPRVEETPPKISKAWSWKSSAAGNPCSTRRS